VLRRASTVSGDVQRAYYQTRVLAGLLQGELADSAGGRRVAVKALYLVLTLESIPM
jgi:hypothetical protein